MGRRPRSSLHSHFIRQRELCVSPSPTPALLASIEGETYRKLDTGTYIELYRNANLVRSTISIAFSHDACFFAATHSDYSIKIFAFPSLNLICCFEGHPRTPWTVRFHLHNSSLLVSGCLGG